MKKQVFPNLSEKAKNHFFDVSVKHAKIIECISGENEKPLIKIFKEIGFKEGDDFVHQFPVGNTLVADYGFPNEKIIIEVDGDKHLRKKQARLDRKRDSWLLLNGYISIRITDKELEDSYMISYYKSLIKEFVIERRKLYEGGHLFETDFTKFREEDFYD